MRFAVPLLICLGVMGFLYKGLELNPRELPSTKINKPAPAFSLPRLDDLGSRLDESMLKGQPQLVNIWASWCVGCRAEHPALLMLKERGVPIVGINYKDGYDAAINWLLSEGDPYVVSLQDADGAASRDWGVYGVPETYLVDAQGVIRFKHVGPLTGQVLEQKLLPALKLMQRGEG